MANKLTDLGDSFSRALMESGGVDRKEGLFAWKEEALTQLQATLPEVLSAYVDKALEEWGKVREDDRREATRSRCPTIFSPT
jgi:hypothetical protein